jgi:lipoprotein-anchoring transpeptidase ErfK/SrfK
LRAGARSNIVVGDLMTHYLAVIQRAVNSLETNTVEARAALYDRARRMLRERFSPSTAKLELASLDEAIELIEAETRRRQSIADAAAPRPAVGPPALAEEIPEQSGTERARSRAVLAGGSRRWRKLAAIGAALVIVAAGVAAFWYWPEREPEPVASEERTPVNYVYLRQPVYYRTTHPPGTIIVDKAQNFLYFVRPNVVAIRYGIGLGRECTNVQGLYRVTRKEEWPGFSGRAEDRLKNPLGARAIYFDEKYRIHGTNAPAQVIGDDVNVGCLHLSNEDVIELSDKTPIDTRVVVTE